MRVQDLNIRSGIRKFLEVPLRIKKYNFGASNIVQKDYKKVIQYLLHFFSNSICSVKTVLF